MSNISERIHRVVRDIPDFPKKGIVFKDITPVLADPELSGSIVDHFIGQVEELNIDAVIGVESRGFFFGMPIALALGVPFVPVRKKGKLPYDTVSYEYELEYGSETVEMHVDAIGKGDRVMIHDDLLATGGTAAASAELVDGQGAEVACFSFLLELSFLEGRKKLTGYSENILKLAAC